MVEKVESESGFLDRHIPHQEVCTGTFLIPIFKFEYNIEAKQVLKSLGLDLPFNDQEADLTEMLVNDAMVYPPERLYVSSIIQKSLIELDEEGTIAAAATVADIDCLVGCCQEPIPETMDFVAMFYCLSPSHKLLLYRLYFYFCRITLSQMNLIRKGIQISQKLESCYSNCLL